VTSHRQQRRLRANFQEPVARLCKRPHTFSKACRFNQLSAPIIGRRNLLSCRTPR
jgi:hypothetical protein